MCYYILIFNIVCTYYVTHERIMSTYTHHTFAQNNLYIFYIVYYQIIFLSYVFQKYLYFLVHGIMLSVKIIQCIDSIIITINEYVYDLKT